MDKKNKYIELASHAIGLDRKKPYKRHGKRYYRPYRNFYAASIEDCKNWDVMVHVGYATAGNKKENGGRVYRMTRQGLDWLGKQLGIVILDEEN